MKASVLDLRYRTKELLQAIERSETVTIFYRGKRKAMLFPVRDRKGEERSVAEHPAFGMWKGRRDLASVAQAVRRLRRGRDHAL